MLAVQSANYDVIQGRFRHLLGQKKNGVKIDERQNTWPDDSSRVQIFQVKVFIQLKCILVKTMYKTNITFSEVTWNGADEGLALFPNNQRI
jgi:hypothetical protein